MKVWHLVLLLILLTAGGVVASQEIRYRQQLVEAEALADTAEVLRSQLNVTLESLEDLDGILAQERVARADSARAAAELVAELEVELENQERVTQDTEAELREHLAQDTTGTRMADSLVNSYERRLAGERYVRSTLKAELKQERHLRVVVDSVLFRTRAALEDCLCTLEATETALGAFQDVTDGRGWASRAWDSVTSPRGLLTIGLVGLAAYGTWQLLDGDDGSTYVYQEPGWSIDVGLPFSP